MEKRSDTGDRIHVRQLKNSHIEAFDLLYKKYSHPLYSFSQSMLKTHEDAEGVVQEVFIRVWNKRGELQEQKSFKSFLFSLAYNVIIDHFRKRARDQKYEHFVLHQAQQNYPDPSDTVEYKQLELQVENAINELPEKRKQIYHMSRTEGLSYKEIAQRQQIAVKTVENHINLALRHIRSRLGK
ncbi:MAG: RNA polymerase sigma-70 factor [Bacteroidota bacterium]